MNARELAQTILEKFEQVLDEKDITIPSDDRECEDTEARLFGTEYYRLEDEITEIIEKEMGNA